MQSEPYSSQRKKSPATCSEMILPSPDKRKVNAAAFAAILDITLADMGGDNRPSMQSEPFVCQFLSSRETGVPANLILPRMNPRAPKLLNN
jgi:hypothetical protein